jgi:hypothetical protein
MALPFREKLLRLEQLAETAEAIRAAPTIASPKQRRAADPTVATRGELGPGYRATRSTASMTGPIRGFFSNQTIGASDAAASASPARPPASRPR